LSIANLSPVTSAMRAAILSHIESTRVEGDRN